MQFTLEPREEAEAAGGKKRKERVRKTIARVTGKPSMMMDEEEEEEEEDPAAPPAKTQKLMGGAIRTGDAPSKPKSAPKPSAPAQAPRQQLPRDQQGIYQLQKRTRPQCLKFKKKKSH
nr:uncharacterized protein LOC109783741 [Aegilops tauschii subsp. strangulata]